MFQQTRGTWRPWTALAPTRCLGLVVLARGTESKTSYTRPHARADKVSDHGVVGGKLVCIGFSGVEKVSGQGMHCGSFTTWRSDRRSSRGGYYMTANPARLQSSRRLPREWQRKRSKRRLRPPWRLHPRTQQFHSEDSGCTTAPTTPPRRQCAKPGAVVPHRGRRSGHLVWASKIGRRSVTMMLQPKWSSGARHSADWRDVARTPADRVA